MRHVSILLTAAALAVACDTAEPTDTAQPSEAQQIEDEGDADAPEELAAREHRGHHGKRMHGNPAEHLCARLGCSDEQRTSIEALFERPKGERPDDSAAKKALADAFRSDKFSEADLEAFASAAHGGRGGKAKHVETLAALHGILTPEQRAKMADEIAQRGGFGKDRGPRGDKGGKFADHDKSGKFVEHKVDKLCAAVECSDDQRKKIAAIVGQAKAERPEPQSDAHRQILADAMRSETFDAAAVQKQLEAEGGAAGGRHAARHESLVAIHDVLTPEQRNRVADRIEAEGPGALLGGHGKHRRGRK